MADKLSYHQLAPSLLATMEEDKRAGTFGRFAFQDEAVIRREQEKDRHTVLRPAFIRDCDKILHLPVYNRYNDKTQVFSFYQNDDLTRRGLHVQLVSRIARNIGRLLGLNLDLIEAIALGHDLGHTPFGHAGERILNQLLAEHTGGHFMHNVHSVRVLDQLYSRNISLQVLDGILCHNGEFPQRAYQPVTGLTFQDLDARIEFCNKQGDTDETKKKLIPGTLEACVVRVSDMIAYLGKDRQDAVTAHIIPDLSDFTNTEIGMQNATIINNLVVDIVTNSYGKDYITLSEAAYRDLKIAKDENRIKIYQNEKVETVYRQEVEPMFRQLYEGLLTDLKQSNTDSPIYKHHIYHLQNNAYTYTERLRYDEEEQNQIVVDYLASMTDSYFVALYKQLFPDSKRMIHLHSYFEDLA